MQINKINTLIPKQNLQQIYTYLMKEGTIVCKKDPKSKHMELPIPNLHVMMTMKSLTSKNYVTQHYNWRYLYYVLNNEGIEYLRDWLQVPAAINPETLTQRPRPQRTGGPREGGPRGPREGRPDRAPEEGQWRSEGTMSRGMGQRPVYAQS
eukprot:Blabericola_migrator_1__5595@NODE_2849_length_2288_cov_294_107159_g1786_i0_p3_GENE_NODE_2849_length_2288_cov_294_107159_g1786_i0NODE_2849_length_2288_cov_294_107159_g1786_i0_p3_ORF_typecomplete_len151_score19_45S10_plectin/PF03501_15/2_8e34_NODE_2849_length_2288_cov_294_107159_g1786_i090542